MPPNAPNESSTMSLLSEPEDALFQTQPCTSSTCASSATIATEDLLGLDDMNSADGTQVNHSTSTPYLFYEQATTQQQQQKQLEQQQQKQQEEEQAQDNAILSLATELSQGQTAARSMQLDEAFQSLETMRKANLEIEFGRAVDCRKCVQCLRKSLTAKRPRTPSQYYQRMLQRPSLKKPKPCLMCGSPTCVQHADKAFKKSKVIICTECSPLFSLDFVIQCVAYKHDTEDPDAAHKQRHQIKHMIDVYDRVRLLLEYTAQFIDEIADTLEKMSKKEDKIGLGCNTSGVASGVAGVAAAACFVTPAGPPLLIASLLFSGASQLTSTGSKMVNYYSTPNRIAFKIISLYNVCKSVLTVTTVLRDALLKDHINLEKYVENMIKETEEAVLEMKTGFEEEEEGSSDDEDKVEEEEEVDDNFFDDSSISSANSANPSIRSGVGNAFFDNNSETPLDKIDESESWIEVNDTNSKLSQMGSPGSLDGYDFENGSSPTTERVPQHESRVVSVDTAMVQTSPQSSSETAPVVAPKTGLFSSWKRTSTLSDSSNKDEEAADAEKNAQKTSPSKKERIEKIKETNHFMEREDGVGKLARFYSRSSLAGSSLVSATVTMMAAGAALSLVHFAFEANNLAATIKRIQAGSPSKRAQALRIIKDDVKNLPDTKLIAEEWDKYLEVLVQRQEMIREHVI